MSVLTFSMILSIWRFCVSISLPMSRAMWRKLPMMPLTCSRFSSISFSRASFVTLGVKKQTQLFEAKREEIPLKLWLTPNLSCILPCLSAVGHATVLSFEKRGLLSSYPENLHMLIFFGCWDQLSEFVTLNLYCSFLLLLKVLLSELICTTYYASLVAMGFLKICGRMKGCFIWICVWLQCGKCQRAVELKLYQLLVFNYAGYRTVLTDLGLVKILGKKILAQPCI